MAVALVLTLPRLHDQPTGFDVHQIRHEFGHAGMPSTDLRAATFVDSNSDATAARHRVDDLALPLLRLIVEVPSTLARETESAHQQSRLVQFFTGNQDSTKDVPVPTNRFVHERVNGHRGTIPVGYDTC
ncbi:hypothetical protein [Nocardia suismassiliense]|uniref:hypothetical protein n=1 Tax=Nocardia suismassiliense TaxID=2077092 RepID=UPI00131F2A7B|nr:hypothetical protein [Nocardia suismassiliense]